MYISSKFTFPCYLEGSMQEQHYGGGDAEQGSSGTGQVCLGQTCLQQHSPELKKGEVLLAPIPSTQQFS